MTTDYALPDALTASTRDPWAAECFQVMKNGTRYYADPLPPCDLIPDPHADPVPGFSSLKPSKPFRKSVTVGDRKYTVPLDWYRAGEYVKQLSLADTHSFALDHDRNAWADFYQSVHVQRDRDFARGHAIHRAAEAVLLGKQHHETNADAQPYLPHLIAWLKANVTDVYALEAVVFGDGYGGTGDAWLGVRGVAAYVDFKSRGADSAHGIYEEEIAQGGAYTSARYCILPSDDRQRAVRAPLPAASYGLVLSIRPDGVAEYWYELRKARDAFSLMFDAYKATSVSGKLARAAKAKDPTTVNETAKRMPKMSPLAEASRDVTEQQITEGAAADDVDVDALRDRYKALTPYHRTWLEELREQANRAGVDFHLSRRTERRYNLMLGLVSLCENEYDDLKQVVKALARHVLADDAVAWPTIPAGAAVGMCDHAQAHEFRVLCQLVAGGEVRVEDGEVVG